ncbi:MAG TPA: hypothetical protein GXZ47_06550 [Treponema sp.]|nr:hypothetical protein [Treponema sp.]
MESVHYFVWGLFRGLQNTQEIREQCEELETHIIDRVEDYTHSGVSEKDAFSLVVKSLGDLSELIDTITGEKKKVLIKKLDFLLMGVAAIFGTVYMAAVGVWFYFHGFGFNAIYVVVPAWLGFFVPTVLKYIDYRMHPEEVASVTVTTYKEIKSSVSGWFILSVACWVANLLLVHSDTFLSVMWAWMPMVAMMTWPGIDFLRLWLIKNDTVLIAAEEMKS